MAEIVLQSIVNGLTMGMIYVLIALGLTLLYGIMHIINFAHGEIYMLGGFGSYLLVAKLGMNYFATLPLVMIMLFVFGVVLERVLFRPVRGKFINCLLVTLGLSYILQSLGWSFFGTEDVRVASPISGAIHIGAIFMPSERLLAALIGLLLVALLYLLVQRTKIGRQMRAIEQDSEASGLFGVNVNTVNIVALGIGFALAAVGGALVGSVFFLNPSIGFMPMLKAFIIIILGGLGSIGGCVAGGLILGVIDSVAATLLGAQIAYAMVFAILIVVIILRPTGIAGHA